MGSLAKLILLFFAMVFLPLQIYADCTQTTWTATDWPTACTPAAPDYENPYCPTDGTITPTPTADGTTLCNNPSGIAAGQSCATASPANCTASCKRYQPLHHDASGNAAWQLVCHSPANTYAWAQGFLTNFLEPFYEMIIIVARLIGIFLVIWGLMRVRRHGQHNMMYRLSPMATVMYFFVGALFAAFMPFALSFSGGIFGASTQYTPTGTNPTSVGINTNLLYKCSEGGGGTSSANLSGAVYCPVLGYANEVTQNKTGLQNNPQQAMMQVVYAVLLVIGVISFLRGFLFLLKMGEGQGQDGSMQKAVVHILAGVIGMNAQSFQDLLSGALPSHINSG